MKPVSVEVKDALQACEDLRGLQGPFMSDRADLLIHKVETTLRHLLHILVDNVPVKERSC